MKETFIVNTDGGARGNPGPAACAFIVSFGGQTIYKNSFYLGVSTNNKSEYQGVISALRYLASEPKRFSGKIIIFILDSEVVSKQLSGLYKIKNKDLKNLLSIAKALEKIINSEILYSVVGREKNLEADLLVNNKLDETLGISRHLR